MKNNLLAYLILLSIGCTSPNQHNLKHSNSINGQTPISYSKFDSYKDSLSNLKIDTSTLKGKRENILRNFLKDHPINGPDHDSLIDLNFDGYSDYLIFYYGLAGTGLKYMMQVYLYNKRIKSYIIDRQLSDIRNPTFYLKERKITGFYIGNGGGDGEKLEWIDTSWVTTKRFSVNRNGDDSVYWKISYPLRHIKDSLFGPYQMIPPQKVLESNVKF